MTNSTDQTVPSSSTDTPSVGSRVPTVLQVLPALEAGGVERGTCDMAEAIQEAGWNAMVASEGGRMVRFVERAGAEHVTMPLDTKSYFAIQKNAKALADLIKEKQVDIVHARSRAPAWSALKACEMTGVPLVTTFHGTYNFGSLDFGLKKKYNSVMTKGKRVIAISNFIEDHIKTHYDVDPNIIRTIPRGVDINVFSPELVSAERVIALVDKWRLPDDRPIIMMPGRLTRWKGQTVLIDAMRFVQETNGLCLLVGDDQGRVAYREELEAMIKNHNLEYYVQLTGPCEDMAAAYKVADLVISASTDPEAFGRVSVEAQAMGRPVLATNHGGSAETVIDNETGWLVPPKDSHAIADGIKRAPAVSHQRRMEIAEEGRKRVLDGYTKQQMCSATLDVYEEILRDA